MSRSCHPQTIDVLKTRSEPFNIKLKITDISDSDFEDDVLFVVDDRQKVVDMWRDLGLVVLQPAPGNF